jgi:glycosyltransferase involved in cell wall biosynthesis
LKKSLLFIIPSLAVGGAERSLVTLLSLLDYDEYNVDLMLFRRDGLFLKQVPSQVNIIDAGKDYSIFDGDFKRCISYCIKHTKLNLAISRVSYLLALKKSESKRKCALVWKYLSCSLPQLKTEYDVSIGYLEGNSIYYCIDKTHAKKKIGYIHSDYKKLEKNTEFDRDYFNILDFVVTVSPVCEESIIKEIPSLQGKTVVIENIVSNTAIKRLAISSPVFDCAPDCIKLLTVGRISKEKGIDLALSACEILVREGYHICWYVIGSGEQESNLEKMIKVKGLEKHFVLTGQKENPYQYMGQCDIYVQPSRYEGKSIAIDEIKVFEKPIVATNFTTVRDQIEDGITGLIAEIDAASIMDKIKQLIDSPEMRRTLSNHLKERAAGNECELNKFNDLINS